MCVNFSFRKRRANGTFIGNSKNLHKYIIHNVQSTCTQQGIAFKMFYRLCLTIQFIYMAHGLYYIVRIARISFHVHYFEPYRVLYSATRSVTVDSLPIQHAPLHNNMNVWRNTRPPQDTPIVKCDVKTL